MKKKIRPSRPLPAHWLAVRPLGLDFLDGNLLLGSHRALTRYSAHPYLAGFRGDLAVVELHRSRYCTRRAFNFLASALLAHPAAPLFVSAGDFASSSLLPALARQARALRYEGEGPQFQLQILAAPAPGGIVSNFRRFFPGMALPALVLGLSSAQAVAKEATALGVPALAPIPPHQVYDFLPYPLPMNSTPLEVQLILWQALMATLVRTQRLRGRAFAGKWNRTTTLAFSGPRSTVKPSRRRETRPSL